MTDETLTMMRIKALAAARTVLGTRDQGDSAEDIAQIALLQAWRQRALALAGDEAAAWIYCIARNYAGMSRRCRRRRAECSLSAAATVGRESSIERSIYAAEAMRLAVRLPGYQGYIIERALLDCGQREIAAELGIDIVAMRQHLYRARRAMRRIAGSLYFNSTGE
jgi:DNA-directed RNA polymerase specialized sigma24 family protein